MQLRSPFSLEEVERLADQQLRINLGPDKEYDDVRKPDDPETIYDWTAKNEPHVLANAHKQFLPGLIDHDDLGSYLVNMHWSTIDLSEASHSLLTGDRPLISTHGWKDPRAVLMFPLSPRCVFAATNGKEQTFSVLRRGKSVLVKALNTDIVGCAVDFVVGLDASHITFVERRLRRVGEKPIPGPIGRGRPGCPT
jgi:hypothetical protein